MKNGILILDKPSGVTSHDVVSFIRKKFDMQRVGHAGTLDPLATGILIVLLGPATKLFDKFSSFDKAYEATVKLGMVTDTADIQGNVLKTFSCEQISRESIEDALQKFRGEIEQKPPMFSAVRFEGKRLYEIARRGITVEVKPRKINISTLQLLDFSFSEVKLYMECSKGTYVRKIAEDLGEFLGCGGCISQIRRTRVGPFRIEDAVRLEEINESYIRSQI